MDKTYIYIVLNHIHILSFYILHVKIKCDIHSNPVLHSENVVLENLYAINRETRTFEWNP